MPEICDSRLAAPRQEHERETSNTIRARLGVIVVAAFFVPALAALSGCATLRGQDAVSTEQLLATAGFQKRNADSPEQALAEGELWAGSDGMEWGLWGGWLR